MKPKTYLNTLSRAVAVLCVLFLMGCIKIKEDNTKCGIIVRFKYDKNVDYVNKFATRVQRIELHIFDANGRFMESHSAQANPFLPEDFEFKLTHILPGNYTLVAWGNVSNAFNVTPLVVEIPAPTQFNASTLDLIVESGGIARRTENLSLYHSTIQNLVLKGDVEFSQVVTMDLTKFTNHIEVTAKGLPIGSQPVANMPFSCFIYSTNGKYNFAGSHLGNEVVTYYPYPVEIVSDDVFVSNFTILRELNNNVTQSKMVFYDNRGTTPKLLVEIPLVQKMIEIAGDAKNVKNTGDLDRDDVFIFEIEFQIDPVGTVHVYINGWEFAGKKIPIY